MIGAFPDPYPGELFYSVCARLCERAGYSKHRIAMRDIFGGETVIASVVLPSHLDNFVARLPPESAYTSDSLIAEHTLLPFYSPFLSPERLGLLRQDMRGHNGPAIHVRSGIMASHVPLQEWLRFCPQCLVEDRACYGECYWHQVHQVTGVEVCPFHEVYLQKSTVRARNKKTRHQFVSAEHTIQEAQQQRSSQSRSPYHQNLLDIARDVNWLLCQHKLSPDVTLLHHRYRKLLFERDLATYRGRVDISQLLQKFKDCYPSQLLQILGCELEEHVQASWLLRLVRAPHGAQHPLHHLLLIRFLGYSAEEFFAISFENKPFGAGPWPCLNSTCKHYKQLYIRECQIVHSQYVGGKPIGTFTCVCGFTYSRTGPDTSETNQFQRNKIKSFGFTWETRLQVLWKDETASLRAIARQLGVDPVTIKRQATRIGLLFPRPVRRCLLKKIHEKVAIPLVEGSERVALETYRMIWLVTIQEHFEEGVKILRRVEPGVYSWLYKNDKLWLHMHTPLSKKLKSPPHRVDWQKRDSQLVEEVKEAVLLLKNIFERPVHITVSAIGREIGQLALLQQHLDKLPRTAEALRECIETREAFAVRRVI